MQPDRAAKRENRDGATNTTKHAHEISDALFIRQSTHNTRTYQRRCGAAPSDISQVDRRLRRRCMANRPMTQTSGRANTRALANALRTTRSSFVVFILPKPSRSQSSGRELSRLRPRRAQLAMGPRRRVGARSADSLARGAEPPGRRCRCVCSPRGPGTPTPEAAPLSTCTTSC